MMHGAPEHPGGTQQTVVTSSEALATAEEGSGPSLAHSVLMLR
jgi:hypothetical protein